MAEKAIPSHVAPITLLNASPITFSLGHPDLCCSLHSPRTFLSQSFCTCYSLSLPCSSLLRLTPLFIQAPAPKPPLQIGCFCLPCLKQHPLIPLASYSAFLIKNIYYRISYMRQTWGAAMSTDWGTELRYILALPLTSYAALDK